MGSYALSSVLSSQGSGGREWKSIYISRRGRPHPISDQKGATRREEMRLRTSPFSGNSHLKLNSKRIQHPSIFSSNFPAVMMTDRERLLASSRILGPKLILVARCCENVAGRVRIALAENAGCLQNGSHMLLSLFLPLLQNEHETR